MSSIITGITVNTPERSSSFDVFRLLINPQHPRTSPIDDYLRYTSELFVNTNSTVIGTPHSFLAILGSISGVEYYIRSILMQGVNTCPIARGGARKVNMPRGAVDYYSPQRINLGMLENVSFTGSKEIKKYSSDLLGISIGGSSIDKALTDYEKICILRHASVHSRSYLNSNNSTEIGSHGMGEKKVYADLANFQEVLEICNNVVRAYNTFVFNEILSRWIIKEILVGVYDIDKEKWTKLYNLFRCRTDGHVSTALTEYTKIETAINSIRSSRAASHT